MTTTNDKGEIEGAKYDRVGVVLVNAIREQQTQVESLKKQNRAHQETLERQQKQIWRFEANRLLYESAGRHLQITRGITTRQAINKVMSCLSESW